VIEPDTRISLSVVKPVAYPFGQGQFGLSEAYKRARLGFLQIELVMCRKIR